MLLKPSFMILLNTLETCIKYVSRILGDYGSPHLSDGGSESEISSPLVYGICFCETDHETRMMVETDQELKQYFQNNSHEYMYKRHSSTTNALFLTINKCSNAELCTDETHK